MKDYKKEFIKKFGLEMWEHNKEVWKQRGYKIDTKTGLLKQLNQLSK